ncbi:hypothetical protein JTE90_000341 [Oedothorax gibbosus]|uniref:Uncharacterized protein n=1 Tax=Oedothorax gibbosus TaxID=931172 RepID=A0AAV6U063_9ARAC|nr:hypothetical protein JTE90_000341 [Oedothorax gibbosus]
MKCTRKLSNIWKETLEPGAIFPERQVQTIPRNREKKMTSSWKVFRETTSFLSPVQSSGGFGETSQLVEPTERSWKICVRIVLRGSTEKESFDILFGQTLA